MSFQIKYVYDLVDKISPTLKKVQGSLDQTAAKVKRSSNSMAASFDKVKRKLDAVGKKAGEVGRSLFIKTTLPIALLGGSFIKMASDFEESLNKVDVAFGNSSKIVKDFAKTAGKKFGIDRGSALDMAAMFGDMSTSMGLSELKASELSTTLVGLAGDLASFKNIRVEQAQTALAAIYTGETESLKRLGIVMTETNLQQFALTQGIRKKVSKLTQAEKVLLRYNYVVAMSKNSVGDFQRTQEGFANQTRILASRFKDLGITLGTIMLPIATKVIGVVIRLVEKFQALSPVTQKIILIVAGLVAVLGPLLIAVSLMIPALTLFATGIGLLISPIGAAVLGIAALSAAALFLKDDFMVVYEFLKDTFLGVFDEIVSKINKAMYLFNKFRSDAATVLSFVGLESAASVITPPSTINQTQPINQSQAITAGGSLDINFSNMPRGTKANFTPIDNSFLNTGINSTYAAQ